MSALKPEREGKAFDSRYIMRASEAYDEGGRAGESCHARTIEGGVEGKYERALNDI